MEHTYLEEKDLNRIKRSHFIDQMSDEAEKQKAREFFTSEPEPKDETDCYYPDADSFRQGSCQLFALALHDVFEYPVFELSFNHSHHWFCKTTKGDRQYYIDVRGITNDFCKFRKTLCFPSISVDVSLEYNIEQDRPGDNEYVNQFGLGFAKWIIERDKCFYDIEHYVMLDNIASLIDSI